MMSKLLKICIIFAASGVLLLLAGAMPLPQNTRSQNINPEIAKLQKHSVNSKNLSSSDIQLKNPLILLELTVE